MAVRVIEKGPALQATCSRCKSVLEFEAAEAGVQRFVPNGRWFFRVNCPVCGADVFRVKD